MKHKFTNWDQVASKFGKKAANRFEYEVQCLIKLADANGIHLQIDHKPKIEDPILVVIKDEPELFNDEA